MPRIRPRLTTEDILWLYKRIVKPACNDLRTSVPMPVVLQWVYLQGMYDAMQVLENSDAN